MAQSFLPPALRDVAVKVSKLLKERGETIAVAETVSFFFFLFLFISVSLFLCSSVLCCVALCCAACDEGTLSCGWLGMAGK